MMNERETQDDQVELDVYQEMELAQLHGESQGDGDAE